MLVLLVGIGPVLEEHAAQLQDRLGHHKLGAEMQRTAAVGILATVLPTTLKHFLPE
jgi:hypothetical protein